MDRKIFFLDLKENHRGRVLKTTEDVGGRRNMIMLPAEAFQDFLEASQRLIEFEASLCRFVDRGVGTSRRNEFLLWLIHTRFVARLLDIFRSL